MKARYLLTALLAAVALLTALFVRRGPTFEPTRISRDTLDQLASAGQLLSGTLERRDGSVLVEVRGKFRDSASRTNDFVVKTRLNRELEKKLVDAGFTYRWPSLPMRIYVHWRGAVNEMLEKKD